MSDHIKNVPSIYPNWSIPEECIFDKSLKPNPIKSIGNILSNVPTFAWTDSSLFLLNFMSPINVYLLVFLTLMLKSHKWESSITCVCKTLDIVFLTWKMVLHRTEVCPKSADVFVIKSIFFVVRIRNKLSRERRLNRITQKEQRKTYTA